MRWKEIPKCVCAFEDRVHIASNILRVREKFFSNEEIRKLAKKKYENRPIDFSRTNDIHLDIAVDYDEVARLFFQLHPSKINQKNLVFQ